MKNRFFSVITLSFLSFLSIKGHCQTLNISDLIRLVDYSDTGASNYLIKEKHFSERLLKVPVNVPRITQYNKSEKNFSEMIVKTQSPSPYGGYYHTLTYEIEHLANADSFLAQLPALSFRLTSKEADKEKNVWVYEDRLYAVSIYVLLRINKVSIQINSKKTGVFKPMLAN